MDDFHTCEECGLEMWKSSVEVAKAYHIVYGLEDQYYACTCPHCGGENRRKGVAFK